jgi:putative DNA primase/helicase
LNVKEDVDVPVLLLQDFQKLFEANQNRNLSSTEVIEALARLEERPWPDYHNGKPITARGVVKLLAPFKIKPTQIAISGGHRPNGYFASSFQEAFERYLPRKPV